MNLLTKEIEKKFNEHPFGSQDGLGGKAEVLVKYFNPAGAGTWLITEAEKRDDDWILFGYCNINEWEWGTVSLNELQNFKGPFGLGIERDLYVGNNKYIKDFVDYPYDKNIALKSGYYFLPAKKDELPFEDRLKNTGKIVSLDGEELELYSAMDYETETEIDDFFGDNLGYDIDEHLVSEEKDFEI